MKISFTTLFGALLVSAGPFLVAGCSVVSKDPEKLSGLRELAEWRANLEPAKTAGASEKKYSLARQKVNSLISPTLVTEVDRVGNQSIFGIGGTVDFSKESILDSATTSAVNDFFSSNMASESAERNVAIAAIVTVLLQWGDKAATESRNVSATELKKKLYGYQWPPWDEVK